MTVAYVEEYIIRGVLWGIEDREDGRPPEEHFFAYDKTRKRFSCWRGGGGFGQCDTLEDARNCLMDYARQLTSEEKRKAELTVKECEAELAKLEPQVNPYAMLLVKS